MKKMITGEEFYNMLSRVFKELDGDLYKSYLKRTLWTEQIEDIYKKLERELKTELQNKGLTLFSDNVNGKFMKIDASFWIENLFIKDEKLNAIDIATVENKKWFPLIAIEHENCKEISLFELKQLLFRTVPLRVLITYSSKTGTSEFSEYVNNYLTVFTELEEYMPMRNGDEFLLLFGITEDNIKKSKTKNIIYNSVLITKVNGEVVPKILSEIELTQ